LSPRLRLAGPAGPIEALLESPAGEAAPRGLVLACHPHPQFGGTMDNKVVQTIARAALLAGFRCLRFNFRGVGTSAGAWDEGRGEIDDALAAADAVRSPGEPLVCAGFSFGGYVASHVAERRGSDRLLLVGPAVVNFALAPVPERTFVVHGEQDDVVPLAAVLDWARPASRPVTVIPGAGHFFHGQLPLLRSLLLPHIG
jgi:alpha/beta superfamily hydrolase